MKREVIQSVANEKRGFAIMLRNGDCIVVNSDTRLQFPPEHPEVVIVTTSTGRTILSRP